MKVHGPIDASEALPLEDLQDQTAHGDGPLSSMCAHESDVDIKVADLELPMQSAFDHREVCP